MKVAGWGVVMGLASMACGTSSSGDTSAAAQGGEGAESGGGTSSVAGSSSTAGSQALAGTAPLDAAGAGGEGGTGAPPLGEVVVEFSCDKWRSSYYDEDTVYYTCQEPKGGDYTDDQVFVLRALANGSTEPVTLATSAQPLDLLAYDETAYYVREWGEFDDVGNTWYGRIRRLLKGTTELTPFVPSPPNRAPNLLLQTDALMLIGQSSDTNTVFSSISAFSKADGKETILSLSLSGTPRAAWLEGTTAKWVMTATKTVPMVYAAALPDGMPNALGGLPELCEHFERYGEGLVAFCRGDGKIDLVQVGLDGSTKALIKGAVTSVYNDLFARDRVYWTTGASGGPETLHAIDDQGVTAELALPSSQRLATLTEHYVYTIARPATQVIVRRFPLSDVK